MKQIELDSLYDINTIVKSEQMIDCSLGINGDILILTQLNTPDRYEQSGIGIFPKVKAEARNQYRIHRISKNSLQYFDITNQTMNYHFVRDLGNDTLLLACARSNYYSNNTYDNNAHIYDNHGNKLREFLIGDGIEDIKVSSKGIIWTSYFDEGVFGNLGWDEPIGSVGLRAWDQEGNAIYSYKAPSDEIFIVDCYALNIDSKDDIWFYFYTEFFIVRLAEDKSIEYWKPHIEGAKVLLVKDNYLLLDKGYHSRNEYQLLKIDGHKIKKLDEFKLADISGEEGEILYYSSSKALLVQRNKLYLLDLERLL